MRRILPFIILFATVLIYTKPYFAPGFFPTQDGGWSVVRLAEMQREIKDLQIPPRWSDYLNHGFGYPLFSFTYPFPFYVGTFFRLFHISLVDTIKIIFVSSVFLSAFFMYLLGRELGGEYAGFLAAIFYTVAPFRLVDLYVRGSIGESVSLAIFPLLCYLGIRYILRPTFPRMILCSVVLAVLILAHNIMALLFFPLWVIFLYTSVISYFEDVKLYTWRYFLPMILLGLGLASYFFIPALLEKKYIILSQINLADKAVNFINLRDYLLSAWTYGRPSFQLGWAHILGTIIALFSFIFAKNIDRKKYLPLAIFIYSGILILVFFAHPYSSEFWNVAPLAWLDFPWRLLTPLAFFLALSTIFLTLNRPGRITGAILAVITVFFSLNFAKPPEHTFQPDTYYATNDATTTSLDELMPLWVTDKPKNRYSVKAEVEEGRGLIFSLGYNSRSIHFRTLAQTPVTVKVNSVYFPGWEFNVDDKPAQITYSHPDGLMRLAVSPGNHQVVGKFAETPIRTWSDLISLISGIIAVILLLFSLSVRLKKTPKV